MDPDLARELREIKDMASAAYMEASGDSLDVLELRNELGDLEDRLRDLFDPLESRLAEMAEIIQRNSDAVEQVHSRVNEIDELAQAIQAELPTQ